MDNFGVERKNLEKGFELPKVSVLLKGAEILNYDPPCHTSRSVVSLCRALHSRG
jgi:hypothetical protein